MVIYRSYLFFYVPDIYNIIWSKNTIELKMSPQINHLDIKYKSKQVEDLYAENYKT